MKLITKVFICRITDLCHVEPRLWTKEAWENNTSPWSESEYSVNIVGLAASFQHQQGPPNLDYLCVCAENEWHQDDQWSSRPLCLSLHLPLSLDKLDKSEGLLWPWSWACWPWWCQRLSDQVQLLLWDQCMCQSLSSVLEDRFESDISSRLKCDGLWVPSEDEKLSRSSGS